MCRVSLLVARTWQSSASTTSPRCKTGVLPRGCRSDPAGTPDWIAPVRPSRTRPRVCRRPPAARRSRPCPLPRTGRRGCPPGSGTTTLPRARSSSHSGSRASCAVRGSRSRVPIEAGQHAVRQQQHILVRHQRAADVGHVDFGLPQDVGLA